MSEQPQKDRIRLVAEHIAGLPAIPATPDVSLVAEVEKILRAMLVDKRELAEAEGDVNRFSYALCALFLGGHIEKLKGHALYQEAQACAAEFIGMTKEVVRLQEENTQLKAHVAELEKRPAGLPPHIVQALNEGDGTYRP